MSACFRMIGLLLPSHFTSRCTKPFGQRRHHHPLDARRHSNDKKHHNLAFTPRTNEVAALQHNIIMSRAISPHHMMQAQQDRELRALEGPPSKRLKRACQSAPHHDAEEDDVAALLLSLSSTRTSMDPKAKKHQERESRDTDQSHRVVSDDEDDDHQERSAGSKRKLKTLASHSKHQLSPAPTKPVDWRSFSRPLGPPPRLPMVPAGYVFPPARTQDALKK